MPDVDKYFQPANSPIATRQRVKNSFDFDGSNESNSIDLKKIRNFSFNSGQGGTLTLGGTANGNGYLQIKDSSGSVIITGDNTGLTITGGDILINGGSLTIYDSQGSLMIDSRGVNSLNQFVSARLFDNSTNQTTSTSYVDLPGSSFTVTNDGTADVNIAINLFIVGLNYQWITDGYEVGYQVYDSFLGTTVMDGAALAGLAATYVTFPAPGVTSVTNRLASQLTSWPNILSVSAGTHNYKLQYTAIGGGTAEITTFSVGVTVLGK